MRIPLFHSWRSLLLVFLVAGTLSSWIGCKSHGTSPIIDPAPGGDITGKARVWLTMGDRSKLLNRETDLPISATGSTGFPVITIDTSARFQVMEGFGAALTGSSAYLLHQKMGAASRADLLKTLFDTVNGIGISYLRLTIGASDFSLSDFSYDDLAPGQTDFTLQHFSLGKDTNDVVPMLKEILQISPKISLLGSPWSPPAWMKTGGSMKGGKLRTDCYDVYAAYFAKYIQDMQARGITIAAITPQNEPLYSTAGYPCMDMQAADELTFIKNSLGPKFRTAGIRTKILIYDHNWDNTSYANSILNDATAASFIAGSAFHAYAGDVSAMSTVHDAHPEKGLWFTEISGGSWATDFASNLLWYMNNIFIGTALNWSKSALLWNLVLDQNHGPTNNGCTNCRGVVTLNTASGQITQNEEYYAAGHFSKFIRPGAARISLTFTQTLTEVSAAAFQNTSGEKVLVVCNNSSAYKSFNVVQGTRNFTCSVPGKSVITVTW